MGFSTLIPRLILGINLGKRNCLAFQEEKEGMKENDRDRVRRIEAERELQRCRKGRGERDGEGKRGAVFKDKSPGFEFSFYY